MSWELVRQAFELPKAKPITQLVALKGLRVAYGLTHLFQVPFKWMFWFLEQRLDRLDVGILTREQQ
jgi:hypothetical protein